jgi:nucleotide-binding universal stress UspA family protein
MDIIEYNKPPVWVVPHNSEYKPLKSIIYATDLEEDDIPTLKRIAELAEKSTAKISAVHVVDDPEKKSKIEKAGTSEDLVKKVGYDDIELVTLLREKDKRPDQVINEFAKRIESTLVVVLKENKSFFEKLFRRSTTKDLIDVSDIPVLVFHEDTF